jgi:hypothetical protein
MESRDLDRVRALLDVRSRIRSFYKKKSEELNHLKNARFVPADWIIDFARNATYTLGAPDGWMPGFPLDNGHPPAPQPEQMRENSRLQLYNIETSQKVEAALDPSITSKAEKKTLRSAKIAQSFQAESLSRQNEMDIAESGVTIKEEFDVVDQQSVLQSAAESTTEEHNKERGLPELSPRKRARHINLSFGLSDSEDESSEGES